MARPIFPVLLVFGAGIAAAQPASVEGLTLNALTGEPLSGVHVKLITGIAGGALGSYGAMSDRAGHFSIDLLRPGTYVLFCERGGYLHLPSKEEAVPNLTLKPGQHLQNFKIEMTPRAILAGRVVDENGDPVQDVSVEAVALGSSAGREFVPFSLTNNSKTDDHGEFRLIVSPGKY